MADEITPIDWDKVAVQQSGGWTGGTADWIWNFGKSAVQSIPELVGITPGEETLRWRNANPVSGFASELAGMAVPYGGWLKAARAIKPLEALATGVEASKLGTEAGKAAYSAKLMESPFLTAGKAEAVRLAPFELGRIAANQVVGDQPFGEMAVGAGINVALGGALAGAFSKVGTLGKTAAPLRELAPEVDETLPPQLLLRKLDEIIPTVPPETVGDLVDRRADIAARAMSEVPARGTKYLAPELATKKDNYLERLFDPTKTMEDGFVETRKPVTGQTPGTFVNPEQWQSVFQEAGIDPNIIPTHMQFPRVVSINAAKDIALSSELGLEPDFARSLDKASKLERKITSKLDPVGDGWFMKAEGDNGMFVMAKKVRGATGEVTPGRTVWVGQVGEDKYATFTTKAEIPPGLKVTAKEVGPEWSPKPGHDDTWIMFKTDQPGQFVKNSQGFMNTNVAMDRWIVGAPEIENLIKDPGATGQALAMQAKFPLEHYMDAVQAAGGVGKLKEWYGKVAPNALKGNAAVQAGKQAILEFVTPYAKQFQGSPRANWTSNMARLMHETAQTFYQKLLQGELGFEGGRAVLSKIVSLPGENNVESLYSALGKENLLGELMRLRRDRIGASGAAELAANGGISRRTAEIAKELENLRLQEHEEFNKALRANGQKEVPFKEGDYWLGRNWEGDYMQVVRDEGGSIVGLSAGGSAKAAAQKAKALSEQLSKETGARYVPGEAFTRNANPKELPKDIIPLLQNPGGMLGDRQIRGFKWDLETPTLKDVLDEANRFMHGRARVMGDNIVQASLGRHIDALTRDEPHMSKMLTKRLDMLAGREGEFSKAQNKALDRVFSRFGFGSNTATRLVANLNTGMAQIQLGAFKLGAPVQNIIGVVNTVMPEIAFQMNAGENAVTRAMGMTMPAVGNKGIVGTVSALAPIKVMGSAFRMIMKPNGEEREFLNNLLNMRAFGAQVGEEFIGQNKKALSNWKGAITSPKALAEFTLALSEWPLIHSERFARVFSAAAAYQVFKNWARIEDPAVLLLQSKKFVERTNYMYSAADRPLAFTSPLGSAMGLFKNWQMNYIHMMAEYAHQGFDKGVWSPLIWQTMGTAAVGGAAATPLYWAGEAAANFFAQKKLMQYAYDEWGDRADGVMFGLPAALTGVSLSSLMTSPGANPVKDATQLFSMATWSRMKEAGGVVKAAMDNWQATGQHPGTDPDVRNGLIKAFAPVLLQRAMAIDWDAGAVKNISTGMTSTKGLSTYDMIMYQMGLQPTTIERQMAASNALYEDKEKMKGATKAFGDALKEALDAKRPVDHIVERAIAMGVDVSKAFASAFTQTRQQDKSSAERLAKPETLAAWRNVLGQ